MRQSKYITIITMACALFFASCSDEYMENMNTDPSKAATIDPNAQLTTAQLQTYGDLSMMEIYRNLCIHPTTDGMLEHHQLRRTPYARQ